MKCNFTYIIYFIPKGVKSMKKTIRVIFSLITIITILLSSFSAYGAVYAPDVELYSEAYMLVNLDDSSFPVVAQKNQDKRMYPASLTKIVTAMVAINKVEDLTLTTSVSKEAYNILLGTGAQVADLKIGNVLTIEQLLYLTLVHSACDATEVLAEYVGGSRENFVSMMNEYSASLGCTGTNFVNPDGLHDENQYTTAADMVKITLDAMKNDTFMKMATTTQYEYNGTVFYHTNLMLNAGYLSYYYEYAQGIKTGSTEEAGYCVVTKASKDGYNYLAVVMGAPVIDYNNDGYVEKCSFIDAASLFKWAFNTLKYSTVFEENEIVSEVAVKNGKGVDTVQLVADKKTNAIVMSSFDKSTIIVETVDKPAEISAPVKKGDVICKAKVIFGGEIITQVDLVAAEDVELSTFLTIINALKGFFSLTVVKIVIATVILFAVVYVFLVFNNTKKGKAKRKKRDDTYHDENDTDYLPPPMPRR